jgi:serine/threonine-protein kinase RsbW
MNSREERVFQARLAEAGDSGAFVQGFCERHGLGRSDALRLTLIVEELFLNTVRHGYGKECDAPIRIGLSLEREGIALFYEDAAPPYDPRARLSEPPSSIASPLESRPVGGLGVYLVGQLVHSVRYAREDECNRLWLRLPCTR